MKLVPPPAPAVAAPFEPLQLDIVVEVVDNHH